MKLLKLYLISFFLIPIIIKLIGSTNYFLQLDLFLPILFNTIFSAYIMHKKKDIYALKTTKWLLFIWMLFFISQIVNIQLNSTPILTEIFSYIILTVLFQNYYKDEKSFDYNKISMVLTYVFIFHLGMGFLFYYTEIHYFSNSYYPNKITGFSSKPEYFTTVLLLLLPFLLSSIINSKSISLPKIIIYTIILVFFILSFIINKSTTEAALLIFLLSIIVYLKSKRKLLLGVLLILVIITSLFILSKYSENTDSTNNRILRLKISKTILEENPLTGIGFNNFAKIYFEHQEKYFKSSGSNDEVPIANTIKLSENEFLQTAIELGVPILLLLLFTVKKIFEPYQSFNTKTFNPKYYFLLITFTLCLFTNPFRAFESQITIIMVSLCFIILNKEKIKYAYKIDRNILLFIILIVISTTVKKQYYLIRWKELSEKTKRTTHPTIFYRDKPISYTTALLSCTKKRLYQNTKS